MSLEPLPWEPFANGSLGFPLHSSRVSWEYRSHGNGCHRSLGGSGATALDGHKKLLFPSSREFLVGKGAPFCYSREFFGNTWTKNSQLDPLFWGVFHPKSSPHFPCAVCCLLFLTLPLAFWEKSLGKVGIPWCGIMRHEGIIGGSL